MALDREAYRALRAGRDETRRIFLGPEIEHFEAMAAAADEPRRSRAGARPPRVGVRRGAARFRRELVAVGIGAAVVIVLLLITVQDVVRLALERRARDPRRDPDGRPAARRRAWRRAWWPT